MTSTVCRKPEREGTPVMPDMVHWWLGRLLITLGCINVLLGFAQYFDASAPSFPGGAVRTIVIALISF